MKRPYPLSYYFLLSLTALITSYPAQAQKDPDIEILEAAHVRTTGSALLEYVAKHTGNDADLLRIPQLLAALDDEQFSHREKAHKVLVALGPPAHAALLRAARNSTGETSTRARICAEAIHKSWQIWERRAAVRRLLALSPHGTVQTLLRFLPYAADTELEEEIWFGIYKRIKAQPDLLAVVQTNLRDVSPVRRALAACIVGKLGNRQQRFVAEALLEDPSADVRLRAAQGLLAAGETKAIPTLIDLLDMPDTTICWQAEELLHWVAGEDSPEAIIGAGSRSSRRSCKSSWQVWWSKHGKDVDLARPQAQGRRPGLFLADENVYPDDRSRKETGLAWLCGCDGVRRWEIPAADFRPVCFLPQNRFLALDTSGSKRPFSERGLTGAILFAPSQHGGSFLAKSCARLPNGNTFVANGRNGCVEFGPNGTVLYETRQFGQDESRFECLQFHSNGRALGRHDTVAHSTIVAQFDPRSGLELARVELPWPAHVPRSFAIQGLANNHYLLAFHDVRGAGEIDAQGNYVWRCRWKDTWESAARLTGGNTIVAMGNGDTGTKLVELTPQGMAVAETLTTHRHAWNVSNGNVTMCFGLLRLGFDTDPARDIDLMKSIPYRLEGLRSKRLMYRRMSAFGLRNIENKPPSLIPVLVDLLDEPDGIVRGDIAEALGLMGEQTLPAILEATNDKRLRVRGSAICLLGNYHFDSGQCGLLAIVQALDDPSYEVRQDAIGTLQTRLFLQRTKYKDWPMSDAQKQIVLPALIKALARKEPRVGKSDVCASQTAAIILGQLGSQAVPAIPALISASSLGDPELQIIAIGALGSIGPDAKAAVPALVSALQRDDIRDRQMRVQRQRIAIWALGQMGPAARKAVPALNKLLGDRDEEMRVEARKALKAIERK